MKSIADSFEKINDKLNPIVVKELRQAVQGKFLIVVLICFLCLQLLTVALFLTNESAFESFNAGRNVCRVLLIILLATCLLFVPAYTGLRLASERADANVDLLFITTLRPRSIIWGKFFSGLILTILIYSACMPFMTFTYLLRGVDLLSIFILLALIFIVVAVGIQCAMLIGCVPTNRVFKVILGIGCFWCVVTFFIPLSVVMFMPGGLLDSGIGSQLGSWEFWRVALGVLGGGAALITLCALLSTALISPLSANRALPIRIFITAVWLLTGIGAVIWSIGVNDLGPIWTWGFIHTLLFSIGLFVAVSERESLGQRVRQDIPRRRLPRLVAFLFYSGAASGVAWSSLMIILTALPIAAWISIFPYMFDHVLETLGSLVALGLYAFGYALGASVIRRRFLADRITCGYTWMIALVLFGITTTIIPLALFFLSGEWKQEWLIASPLGPLLFTAEVSLLLGDESSLVLHSIVIATIGAVFAGALSLPWLVRQIDDFRPLREETASDPQTNGSGEV